MSKPPLILDNWFNEITLCGDLDRQAIWLAAHLRVPNHMQSLELYEMPITPSLGLETLSEADGISGTANCWFNLYSPN